MYVYSRTHSI